MDSLKLPYWFAGILLALVSTLFINDFYIASVVESVAIAALIGVSLRFVLLMGELNFATAAFVGIGAYSAGLAVTVLQWPFLVALISGGVVAALVSIVFGLITLRTTDEYFLLIGFAFTEAMRILYSKLAILGGNSGMVGIYPPMGLSPWMPTFVVAVSLLLIFGLYVLERSDFGKILTAIRNNEDVVRSVGLNSMFCKVACFALASFVAGLAGSMHAFVNSVISPADFSYLVVAFALAYVKVGGEENILGTIVGAVLLVVLGSYALGLGGLENIFYGAAIVIFVLLLPEGVIGIARGVRKRLKE